VPKIISIFIENKIYLIIETNIHTISLKIKEEALKLGFFACGFAKAVSLEKERNALDAYLKKGYHGNMKYMENHFEKRLDPILLQEGTKSVISVLYNYFTTKKQIDSKAPVLSKYAYGEDYHDVIKRKLNKLLNYIKTLNPEINGRVFVDSAPILERAWAQKAGLGWVGKNGNLIHKDSGSFFFIGELFVDIELEYNEIPIKNYCGQCTRCIEACPTKAIVAPGIVDGSKCISYLTIELKDEIPEEFKGKMQNRVFGCDICQDVCPFNKKAQIHSEEAFNPTVELIQLKEDEWYTINEDTFKKLFGRSAVKRTKFSGLKRNLNFLKDQT
jgi:epoxyqueuosine reductase